MNNRITCTAADAPAWLHRQPRYAETFSALGANAPQFERDLDGGAPLRSAAVGRIESARVTDLHRPRIAVSTNEKSGAEGKLIVVSNRVAVPRELRAGGLASALKGTLADHGGIWFGWSGQIAEVPRFDIQADPVHPVHYATLDLNRADYEDYYAGFANRVLWPLFHYRLHLLDFRRETLTAYRRVSANFADRLVDLISPEDTVWVHDYHLIPLGAALRSRGVNARIGFFLHTPMAPPELLASLPQHRDLMSAFSAYDLVGFQTAADQRSFTEYAQRELHASVEADGRVRIDRRTFRIGTFPIGIDTATIETLGQRSANSTALRHLRESNAGRELMVGVDRLDYSKGLPERFRAFGRLLEKHPEFQRQVMLLQVAPPTRGDVPEYREVRERLETIAGSINSEFAEPDWTPIRYLSKSYQQARLAGFYRSARVGLVTPLRDGMNLVAKEYVAAQDPENPGVLVLSRFAGSAQELTDALLVNPFDTEQVVEAMRQALTMPLAERKRRWQRMIEHLRSHDVTAWRNGFLHALRTCPRPATEARVAPETIRLGSV